MATYMLTYTYAPEMAERRAPHRADHLAHLNQAKQAGRLSLAGAFNDPVDGALLLVEADNPGEVLAWCSNDPYARAGLIRGVSVRELTVAVRA
jgi:uncharacterized protein YciI